MKRWKKTVGSPKACVSFQTARGRGAGADSRFRTAAQRFVSNGTIILRDGIEDVQGRRTRPPLQRLPYGNAPLRFFFKSRTTPPILRVPRLPGRTVLFEPWRSPLSMLALVWILLAVTASAQGGDPPEPPFDPGGWLNGGDDDEKRRRNRTPNRTRRPPSTSARSIFSAAASGRPRRRRSGTSSTSSRTLRTRRAPRRARTTTRSSAATSSTRADHPSAASTSR